MIKIMEMDRIWKFPYESYSQNVWWTLFDMSSPRSIGGISFRIEKGGSRVSGLLMDFPTKKKVGATKQFAEIPSEIPSEIPCIFLILILYT